MPSSQMQIKRTPLPAVTTAQGGARPAPGLRRRRFSRWLGCSRPRAGRSIRDCLAKPSGLTARADGTILVHADRVSELPMVIELPKGNWQSRAPGAQVRGNRVTLPLPAGILELSPKR